MSNLNKFLFELQCGCFCTLADAEVYFCSFGDSAFNLGLQCIQSYYRKFNHGAKLNFPQTKCNEAMRSARILIEKKLWHGQQSLLHLVLDRGQQDCKE
jgi:hypothetical protein